MFLFGARSFDVRYYFHDLFLGDLGEKFHLLFLLDAPFYQGHPTRI